MPVTIPTISYSAAQMRRDYLSRRQLQPSPESAVIRYIDEEVWDEDQIDNEYGDDSRRGSYDTIAS